MRLRNLLKNLLYAVGCLFLFAPKLTQTANAQTCSGCGLTAGPPYYEVDWYPELPCICYYYARNYYYCGEYDYTWSDPLGCNCIY
ncbi:MAG TPA: hypothetical protein VKV74_17325 [Bryobacteraceae bacterium]|nr:hypothetical protein [Bryobacteraceae bacterium]